MAFQNSPKVYAQGVGSTSPSSTWIDVRDPTSYDVNFLVGQIWQNTTDANLWFLNSFTSTSGNLQADWQLIDTSSTDAILTINNIQPNASGNFTLTAGDNITLTPGSNAITISSSEVEGVSLFVVDSQGNAGYTTIQDAVDAAVLLANATTPQTVWIWPGTYAEDVTLPDFVNLAAAAEGSVFIVGNSQYLSSIADAFCSISNVNFITPSGGGTAFTINSQLAANNSSLLIEACGFSATFGTGFAAIDDNHVVNTVAFSCIFSSDIGFSNLNLQHGTVINFENCTFSSQDTPSVLAHLIVSFIACGGIESFQVIDGVFVFIRSCDFQSISDLSVFEVGTGANLDIQNCVVTCNSSNTFWVTGYDPGSGITYGNLFYNAISPSRGSSTKIDPSLTLSNYQLQVGNISFDGDATTSLNTQTQGTIHQVLLGTGTSAINVVSGTGTSGQVLTSQGASSDPIWSDSAGDITQVGDVTSGAAFSGTQGTTLTSTSTGFTITTAAAATTSSVGAPVTISAGTGGSSSGEGGNLIIESGSANSATSNNASGNITIRTGTQRGQPSSPPIINIVGTSYDAQFASSVSIRSKRISTNVIKVIGTGASASADILSYTLSQFKSFGSCTIFYAVAIIDLIGDETQVCQGQIAVVCAITSAFSAASGSATQIYSSEVRAGPMGADLATVWSLTTSGTTATVSVTASTMGITGSYVLYMTVVSNSDADFDLL